MMCTLGDERFDASGKPGLFKLLQLPFCMLFAERRLSVLDLESEWIEVRNAIDEQAAEVVQVLHRCHIEFRDLHAGPLSFADTQQPQEALPGEWFGLDAARLHRTVEAADVGAGFEVLHQNSPGATWKHGTPASRHICTTLSRSSKTAVRRLYSGGAFSADHTFLRIT